VDPIEIERIVRANIDKTVLVVYMEGTSQNLLCIPSMMRASFVT
jgi:hypothetical protein